MARGVDKLVKQDFICTLVVAPGNSTCREEYVRARASTFSDGTDSLIRRVLSANGHAPSANMHQVMRCGDPQRLEVSGV